MKVRGSVKPQTFTAEMNPRNDETVILLFRENAKEFSEEDETTGQTMTGYEYDEYKIVAPKNYASVYSNEEWLVLAKANDPEPQPTIEDRLVAAEQAILDMALM